MHELGDLIARFFSGGGTRGLSGDALRVLPSRPGLDFYESALRLHEIDDDPVADPELLWSGPRGGLMAHLRDAHTGDIAHFTDALIILAADDWRRASDAWARRAAALVAERFKTWCDAEDLHLPFPQRPLGVRIIGDGTDETGGERLGLKSGDFVTGLAPHVYAGPLEASQPLLAVYVNIPGKGDDYREVGCLWSDQLLFTLGNHWLDNARLPTLPRAALYRLQQHADGGFSHTIDPDVLDRYRIRNQPTASGAPNVLTIEDADAEPLLHLVLAMPSESTLGGARAEFGFAEPVLQRSTTLFEMRGSRTVVPDELPERLLALIETGVLLQKVHFHRVMRGYDVYMGAGGAIGTAIAEPVATFRVRGDEVSLDARTPGVRLNGRPLEVGRPTPLCGDADVSYGAQVHRYIDLSGVRVPGWPYLGEIRRAGARVHLVFGARYTLGRDRGCKVRLPDARHNANIAWHPGVDEGATIRARSGHIPKSRFYTDSIMVASKHAEIDLTGEPILRSLARHCYTFVRRDGEILSLQPTAAGKGETEVPLRSGDEVLIGNQIFAVDFPPQPTADHRSAPASALSAETDAPGDEQPPSLGRLRTVDVPAAAGLGERGPAPRPPRLDVEPVNSLLGTEPPSSGRPPPAPSEDPPSPGLMVTVEIEPDPGGAERFDRSRIEDADVVVVDEAGSQIELSRPARLVLVGWMLSGEQIVGNHRRADAIIPENRAQPGQEFAAADYFRVFARGRRARVERFDHPDAGAVEEVGEELRFEVIRRAPDGEEEFTVPLVLRRESGLPDPRARLLAIGLGDPMASALFTLGLPLGRARRITLGPIVARATFDGDHLRLSDYLDTYRQGDAFAPFFVRSGDRAFRTVPEDGREVVLAPGAQIIANRALYRFEV